MASELRVDRIIPVNGVPTGGGGGVIQVTQGNMNTRATMSASAYVASGLSGTITPTRTDSKPNTIFPIRLISTVSGSSISTSNNRIISKHST